MADEKALLVVRRVDEPSRDFVRRTAANLPRRRVVDVHAANLHHAAPVRLLLNRQIRLTENHEQIGAVGLLEDAAHHQIAVHADDLHIELAVAFRLLLSTYGRAVQIFCDVPSISTLIPSFLKPPLSLVFSEQPQNLS